jgi:pimeloyl-ACP methyl ester carboxylesterase
MTLASSLTLLTDSGSGRPCVVLHERGDTLRLATTLTETLSTKGRVLRIETPVVNDQNWEDLTTALLALLSERAVRHAAFISFGACGALVQALALRALRLVRTIVFVDASTRAHPSRMSRVVDQIEKWLPLGLPLRLAQSGFDAKPFLQRIRCPVLVVISPAASPYERSEATVLEAGLPTAWMATLGTANTSEELAALVLEFQEVPAKCPQKRAAG